MRLLLFLFLSIISISASAVEIYSHQGARGLSPENTMPAYRTALRLGVNYVDMDIGMTKDGILVVTHNFSLNPNITKNSKEQWISRKDLFIKNLTLAQLETYPVGKIKPDTKYARLFAAQYAVPNTHIPTLKEVIDYVKRVAGNRVGFQIEIKTDSEHPESTYSDKRFATALSAFLKEENIIDRTKLQAFSFQALIELQKINFRIKTAYLTEKQAELQARRQDDHITPL